MFSPVEEIKSRLGVTELIQSYIKLQKAGVNYKANCPFHGEKTASFFVSPARQIWHCFGCGRGGDIFKFVIEIEGLDFPEALKLLAQRTGVVLRREDPALRSEKNRLYEVCEEASVVFENSFARTPSVKSYMKERGVKEETLKEFRIGFAPQSWDFLMKALLEKDFKREELEKAGLIIKSEDGSSWYDRFRNRIMFPIADANGRVMGFGGRIFSAVGGSASGGEKTEAKYVNTPATLLYDKSRVLYGFDLAKQEIRTKNQVVIVEGYMDCIMSHQAGVKNTVAVSGTALTSQQLTVLKRLCDTMVSSFDTDSAGDSATKRSLALAAQFEFERKIVEIPLGKDPADTVRESPEKWVEAVAQAKPMVEFYFAKAFKEYNPSTLDGKKSISALLLTFIGELTNEIEKAHWVGELSRRLEIKEESIWKEIGRKGFHKSYDTQGQKDTPSISRVPQRRDVLEERLLALLTAVKEDTMSRELNNHYLTFVSSINQELFNAFTQKVSYDMLSPDLRKQVDVLRFKAEVLGEFTKDTDEEFIICKRELEKQCIKDRLLKLGEEVKQKEKDGNQVEVAMLLEDFHALSGKLKGLN